ncbi:MAG: hypothetical protein GF313_16370 [Caldithrix sp.]|nr:hypothetical protein [Caldithrix sp.]
MAPIRLGIIGCGIAANKLHWPALQKLKEQFEVTMVCNHTEPKAKTFAQRVGDVPYVLQYEQLIEDPKVEAVSIMLPVELNYQVTKAALKAGKHVMLEKPLAVDTGQGKSLLDLTNASDKICMVAENFRYRPVYQTVRQLLEEKRLGRVYSMQWNVFNKITADNPYANTSWRINHKYEGGFVTDAGVHNIAVIRDLFGDITQGFAQSQSVNPKIGAIDQLQFLFKTHQNIHGQLNLNYSSTGCNENRLLISGSAGSLEIHHNRITISDNKGGKQTFTDDHDDGGYAAQYFDFYNAIRHDQPVKSSFYEGLMDLQTILSALQAAKGGRVIAFH